MCREVTTVAPGLTWSWRVTLRLRRAEGRLHDCSLPGDAFSARPHALCCSCLRRWNGDAEDSCTSKCFGTKIYWGSECGHEEGGWICVLRPTNFSGSEGSAEVTYSWWLPGLDAVCRCHKIGEPSQSGCFSARVGPTSSNDLS